MATRYIPAGEEVTWTYGDLSNEELWLWYGFVPDPPMHGGATVTFQLPEGALRGGLGSVARGDSPEAAAARLALLVKAGAFTDDSVNDSNGGSGCRAEQTIPSFLTSCHVIQHVLVPNVLPLLS